MNAPHQLRTLEVSDFYFGLFFALSNQGFYDLRSGRRVNEVLNRTVDLLPELATAHGIDVSRLETALLPHPIYKDRQSLYEAASAALYGGLIDYLGVGLRWTIREKSCFPDDLCDCKPFFLALADHYIECDQSLPNSDQ